MTEGYPSPIPSPPSDGISSLSFSHFSDAAHTNILLASSWDGTVRTYMPDSGGSYTPHASVNPAEVPLLCSAFGVSHRYVYTGALNGNLYEVDTEKGLSTVVGLHEKAISAVSCMHSTEEPWSSSLFGCIATGSWDGDVKLWDVRQPTRSKSSFEVSLGAKVFGMDWVDHTLMVCTSGRKIHLYDVRKHSDTDTFIMSENQQRESSLKYQTRSCALFPNLDGYALGSIEGRVGIDYMEDNEVTAAQGKKKYAFKCHRVDDTVYPVNAVAFHPKGTFATGGCDGTVVMWDAKLKKRLVALPRLATSVAALAFSNGDNAGALLAVAQSYTFEEGEKDHPEDQIFVRTMLDHEVKSSK